MKKKQRVNIKIKKRNISLLFDKILIFRFIKSLHGRFWGIAFILIILAGLFICFLIDSKPVDWSTAFSDFGNNLQTAPYFAGTMFFAAYALWRWRNYLSKTLKKPGSIITLLSFTILGFYLVALMPTSLGIWTYRIHFLGVFLAGLSIASIVVIDTLLSKTRRNQKSTKWRVLRLISFSSILIGGYITYGSSDRILWFDYSLLGELLMLFGFSVWIIIKTYQGEVNQSYLYKILNKLVVIN